MEFNQALIANAEKINGSATSLLRNITSFFKKVGRTITNAGDNVTITTKNIGNYYKILLFQRIHPKRIFLPIPYYFY